MLFVFEKFLSVIDNPVLQIMNIDTLLFVLVLLGINLFLFVTFGFLLHSTEFFLLSLGYQLPFFVFSLKHLNLTIFFHIRLLNLHDLFASICLPFPMLFGLFPHLFHHIDSLLLASSDFTL
jgi:hypothetical protein